MGGIVGWGFIRVWVLASAPLLWSAAGIAADSASGLPSMQGPQLMLYVSKPLGVRAAHPYYGLRIDQTTTTTATAGPAALSPLRRRELLDLRFAPQTPTRIDFGNRISWDPHSHWLGPLGDATTMELQRQRVP